MQNEIDFRKIFCLIIRKKGLFALVALTIMTGGVVYSFVIPKQYEAKSTVFIEKNVLGDLVKGIAVTPSMDETIKVLSYAITSRTILLKAFNDVAVNAKKMSDADAETLSKNISRNITINVKDRNLFKISYRDKDPQFARDFVNALVRRYIEENASSKREEASGATKALSEQLDVFREKLKESELDLNRFKAEKGGIVSIDEGKLFDEINKSKQKLYEIQLRRRQLEGLKPITRKAGDPMQTKLIALEKRFEELRSEYTDRYPEVIKTKSEIDTLKEQIRGRNGQEILVVDPQELEKVEAELQALKMSEEGYKRSIATNQSLLNSIPMAKAGMEKLEIESKNRKAVYDQLLARRGQTEVSTQMELQDKETNFRIVDPAILPVSPVGPNRAKIIFLGIVAGIAGAFGLLLALDYFDKSVRSSVELKTLEFPVLAVIPKICNPVDVIRARRADVRFYSFSGFYFTMIVALLATEALHLSVVDRIVRQVKGIF